MSPQPPAPLAAGGRTSSVDADSPHAAVLAALDYAREDRHDRATGQMLAALIRSCWPTLALAERRAIATALAGRSDLSRELIELFLADHFTVANLLIVVSPQLEDEDFRRIADSRVMPMVRCLARRDLPIDLARSLARLGDSATNLALALNRSLRSDEDLLGQLMRTAAGNAPVARALAARADLPLEARMALFCDLSETDRQQVIRLAERQMLLDFGSGRHGATVAGLSPDQRQTCIDLAKRLEPAAFLNRLNGHLGLAPRYLQAIGEANGGALQAIALAGLGFSVSEATTLLILLGGDTGRSYQDVKRLLDLFERVQWRIAGQFVRAWQTNPPSRREPQMRAPSLGERAEPRQLPVPAAGSVAPRTRTPRDSRELPPRRKA